MASDSKILDVSAVAAEDLTNDQYRFVVLTSEGVRRPDSETETSYGILQNAPEKGEAAAVRLIGISRLEAAEALDASDFAMAEYVSAEDAGKGKNASAAPAYARGFVIEPAGAEGDLASVLLVGPTSPPVSAP